MKVREMIKLAPTWQRIQLGYYDWDDHTLVKSPISTADKIIKMDDFVLDCDVISASAIEDEKYHPYMFIGISMEEGYEFNGI